MRIEYPPPQDNLLENARIAAQKLGIPICISMIFKGQRVSNCTMIIVDGGIPTLRSEDLAIPKASTSFDNKKPSGIPRINSPIEKNTEFAKMIGSPTKFTILIGGIPLFLKDLENDPKMGQFIGAIGISGGTQMQDLAIGFYALIESGFEIKKEWIEETKTLSEQEQTELFNNCKKLGIESIFELEH